MFTYLEVCAGCGGLSYGLEMSGLRAHTLIEINKDCTETLEQNFENVTILQQDMRDIDFKKYKNKIDIVAGGIPCQSFSIAGNRKGLDDKNKGGLFFDFFRCVKDINPLMFLIENVEGLKNIDGGETLKLIIKKMTSLGYYVQYEVLNSVDYNVPQKRKRLIIVGTKYGTIFNFPEKNNNVLTLRDALSDVPESKGYEYSEKKKKILDLVPPGGCWIDLPEDIQKEYMGGSYLSGGGKRGIARRLSWDEPCLTLTTSPHQKQTERCHPEITRPLTTREYARIQTFPDDFKFHGSVGSVYKQIGNAVPCNVGYYLGIEIQKCLKEIYKREIVLKLCYLPINAIEYNYDSVKYIDIVKRNFVSMMNKSVVDFYNSRIKCLYENDVKIQNTDVIKKKMDMISYGLNEEEWTRKEKMRIQDKKINNKIGEIHEYVMSKLEGWEKCKYSENNTISEMCADINKKDGSVFIELKNNFNTMNAASRKGVIANLTQIKKRFPKAIVAIGIINGKDHKKKINGAVELWEYSGKELYGLVYGSDQYYNDILNALDMIHIMDDIKNDTVKNKPLFTEMNESLESKKKKDEIESDDDEIECVKAKKNLVKKKKDEIESDDEIECVKVKKNVVKKKDGTESDDEPKKNVVKKKPMNKTKKRIEKESESSQSDSDENDIKKVTKTKKKVVAKRI